MKRTVEYEYVDIPSIEKVLPEWYREIIHGQIDKLFVAPNNTVVFCICIIKAAHEDTPHTTITFGYETIPIYSTNLSKGKVNYGIIVLL